MVALRIFQSMGFVESPEDIDLAPDAMCEEIMAHGVSVPVRWANTAFTCWDSTIPGQDHILLFNNDNSRVLIGTGGGGEGDGSIALEIKLDLVANKVGKSWCYEAPQNLQNDGGGDVQRLPNSNTVLGFSINGAVQDVDASASFRTGASPWPPSLATSRSARHSTAHHLDSNILVTLASATHSSLPGSFPQQETGARESERRLERLPMDSRS